MNRADALRTLAGFAAVGDGLFRPIPGSLLDQGGALYNVKSSPYGAKGDGKSDDTKAVTAAMDAAVAAGGGVVYFPAGTYVLSGSLIINGRLHLSGAGRDVAVLQWSGAGGMAHGINVYAAANYAAISQLTIRGPHASGTGSGINSGGTHDVVIDDCVIEQWGGKGINTGGKSARWTIRGCRVGDMLDSGIFIAGQTNDCLIQDNVVANNANNGIDINGSQNVIVGNEVIGSGRSGGPMDKWGILISAMAGACDADDNIVARNRVHQGGAQGIIVRGAVGQHANYNIITGNTSVDNSGGNGDGIALDSTGGGVILGSMVVGNICRNNGRHGILVDGTHTNGQTLIDRNTCEANGKIGIVVGPGATDTVLVGNTGKGNKAGQLTDQGTRTIQR